MLQSLLFLNVYCIFVYTTTVLGRLFRGVAHSLRPWLPISLVGLRRRFQFGSPAWWSYLRRSTRRIRGCNTTPTACRQTLPDRQVCQSHFCCPFYIVLCERKLIIDFQFINKNRTKQTYLHRVHWSSNCNRNRTEAGRKLFQSR